MNIKEHASEIAVVVILALTFAAGRYTVKPEIKEVVRVEKQKETEVQTDRTTTIVKGPGGTETTTIVERRREENRESSKEATEKETRPGAGDRHRWSVGVLGALDLSRGIPVYGLQVSKEVLGPVTAGVWGLNNGTIGVSVGLNF